MNRYTTNGEEGEILPNLLGITDEETLHNAEFEGFLMAEILFTEKLTQKTKFSVKYICDTVPLSSPPEDSFQIVCAFSKKKLFPSSPTITPAGRL